MSFLSHLYELFLTSSPWLLFGLAIAGSLKMLIPMGWMNKQLGKHDIKTTIKAAFIGAPLPLCSCGVIPAAIGLRQAGASKAATTSFLVSTPETGIDSMSVSYVLLGPFMTIVRPISAISSAIVAGLLVGKDEHKEAQEEISTVKVSSCCSQNKSPESSSSCQKKESTKATKGTVSKIREGLNYAATKLIDDISLWLLVGLGFAALVQAYLPVDFLTQWGNGFLAMLVMILMSIPMYICATASTPIAAGLLLVGVSPGAVLVFMLVGPATNIATLGVVAKELGKRALFSYLTGVIGVALLSGYIVDELVMKLNIDVVPQVGHEHQVFPTWFTLAASILLAALMLRSFIKSASRFKQRII